MPRPLTTRDTRRDTLGRIVNRFTNTDLQHVLRNKTCTHRGVRHVSDCVKLPNCPFFHDKMASMPSMASIYKDRYCKGDNSDCARYHVFKAMGPHDVPDDLFPNDVDRAKEIIATV